MKIPSLNEFSANFRDSLWYAVAETLCDRHDVDFRIIRRAEHGENIVFLIDDRFVVKIYTPLKNGYNRERAALDFIDGKTSLPFPEVVAHGEFEGYYYLITTQMTGKQMDRTQWLRLSPKIQIGFLTQLARGLKELHSCDAAGLSFDWKEFIRIQLSSVLERQNNQGASPAWLERLPTYLEATLPYLPTDKPDAFQHGDVHFGNLRVKESEKGLRIGGLFDLADSIRGFHEYEFVAIGVLMIQGQGELQREFFRSYGYADNDIDINLRKRLMLLTILYEHSSLRRYAERLSSDAVTFTLENLETAIWAFV